ncbi:MAG: hypothetical protein R2857_09090 [Vampirovibrionales bacterium]
MPRWTTARFSTSSVPRWRPCVWHIGELSESERLYADHYMPYEDVAKLRQTYDKPVLFPANFC